MTMTTDLLLWLLAGTAMGAVYLWLIRYSVAAIVDGNRFGSFACLALRIILAAAAFFAAAQQGALPLLLALSGFIFARTLLLFGIKAG